MAARRRRNGLLTKALGGMYHVSHTVPAVGFLIAALLGVVWWKLRVNASPVIGWIALGFGMIAIFFAVVAAAGFALILLERQRRGRRG